MQLNLHGEGAVYGQMHNRFELLVIEATTIIVREISCMQSLCNPMHVF
jgi:hypothetical protein